MACAVIFIFLLYRVSVNSAWDEDLQSQYQYVASAVLPKPAPKPASAKLDQSSAFLPIGTEDREQQDKVVIPDLKPIPDTAEKGPAEEDAPAPTPAPVVPVAQVPDRTPGVIEDVYLPDGEQPLQIQKPPGRVEPIDTFTPPIHWTKMPERFPVPSGAIIPLPTGKPKSIPTIQHKFSSETDEAKELRKGRLAEVKFEMKRAWDSYSKHAFGHDELIPVQPGFRDVFGGWGATLVDSMDTLWIMGLKDEFDDAYRGVKKIDFTTCARNDIPVFETVIRYLGGLIAAYDVTGGPEGKYPMLLTKALELAEILIGVFDTPNRMPVLYYNWKPAFVSQPHRAATRSGIAELGTLSMEFTRLAQLTGENKYYDAVARITDALHEWQNRDDGTAPLIDGIFPQDVDASGCDKAATTLLMEDAPTPPRMKAQTNPFTPGEPQGYVGKKAATVQTEPLVAAGVLGTDNSRTAAKRSIEPRTEPQGPGSLHWSSEFVSRAGADNSKQAEQPVGADGLPINWDCVAKNLTASHGVQQFGMGGSQDSAYEYFPKQYLLLGGLEKKYQSLHENTVEAVKKHLLYRPMVKDEADILFSAKAKVSSDKTINREYEVTHLTCFLGGMFAMGGKIFDSDEDVEIGRRLTDGCVWAYSSMPSGIMAEYAQVAPCQNTESCSWNETEWGLAIDSDPDAREMQIQAYYGRLAEWEENKQKVIRAEAERMQAEEELGYNFEEPGETTQGTVPGHGQDVAFGGASHKRDGAPRRDDDSQPHQNKRKRALDPETGDTLAFDPSVLDQKAIEEKMKMLEKELDNPTLPAVAPPADDSFGGMAGQVPIDQTQVQQKLEPSTMSLLQAKIPSKPHKPASHDEYVADKIRLENYPPGYTRIGSSDYQLR